MFLEILLKESFINWEWTYNLYVENMGKLIYLRKTLLCTCTRSLRN